MMRMTQLLMLGGLVAFSGCKKAEPTVATDTPTDTDVPTPEPTLYDALGGSAGVNTVLDQFLANVVADTEINWFFADTDAAVLKTMLHDQICAAAGGGCTYTGQTMLAAHEGMAITDAQFNALVADLLAAFDTLGVEYSPNFDGGLPADILVMALGGMQADIVEDPAGDTVYFNQLGGHAAVQAVVDNFLTRVGADARINGFFATTDLALLNHMVVDQVCEATGGACNYTGETMLASHAGLCISEADWGFFIEDFLATLTELNVPYSPTFDGSGAADTLILALAGMHDDIVEDPENDGCI